MADAVAADAFERARELLVHILSHAWRCHAVQFAVEEQGRRLQLLGAFDLGFDLPAARV
jgi:hypothetical protein